MGEQENQLTAAIEAAINAGEWAQGAQLAEQFCRIQPKDAGAWVSRATCLRHLGRIAEALGCARTALSLDESSAEVSDLVKILQRDLSPPQMDSQSAFDSDGLAPTLRDEDPPIEGPDVSEGSLTGAPSSQVVQWDEGDLIDGRYAVQGVMRGGMGEVYFAHDRELGLDIAVKTPLPSALATSSGRARFLREAEAWIGLGLHPNICSAYYVKSIAGIPRLFIEYVDGGSLSQWFKHNRLADTVERLDVAIQITSGMHHAHTFAWRDEEGSEHRGIVHRDLKPANVLMSSRGVPRVTDFGLVGRSDESSDPVETRQVQAPTEVPMTEDSQTSSRSVLAGEVTSSGGVWETVTVGGMAMGTPPYMPPEQWDGAHRAGFPADVYAFGCVLYELFCGRRVFVINPELRRARGDVVKLEWERLHREVEPEDPRKIVADLDPELAMLMGECVSKDPADRPSGFGEVGERLLAVYVRISGRPYPRPAARPSRLLANTLNNRGVSFVTLDQRQRAGRAFAEALRVDPTHFRARYNHTLFSWRYGGATDVEVVEQLDEAFRSGAYDWRDELLAGRLEQTLGYLDRGAGRCERARKRADGESQAERVAAISMCGLLAGNPAEDRAPEIRDRIVRIAQSEPGDPQVQVALAVAADRVEGKAEEARQALAIARQLRPDLPSDIQSAGVQMIPGQSFRYRYPERTGRLVALALSRDGKRLVVAAEGGTVTTVDAIEGRQVERVTLQQRRISALSVLDGGRQALIASPGEPVFSAQLQDGKVTKKYQLHSGHLNGLVVSETAGIVLAVGSDGAATAWDLNSGERVWSKRLHKGFASSVSMTPDGNLAISGGRDGIARVFLPATGDVARELAAHSGEISTVAIEPSGRFFLTGSADKTVKLWSRIGECERILRGHADRISFVAISAGGETAASGSIDGIVRLWDLASGEPLLSVKLDAAIQMGTASSDFGVVMAGHPAGVSALALTGKPELRPGWSVASLVTVGESEERAESFSEHMDQARRLLAQEEFAGAWEEVEKARGIQGYERVEEAVDLATTIGRPFARVQLNAAWEEQSLELHQGAVTALAMADDDSRILTSGSDHRLILCDLSSDEQFRELSSDGEVNASLAFAPDGKSAAGGGLDNIVRVWDLVSLQRVLAFRGHDGCPGVVSWHPGGDLLASASADGSVRLWDVRSGRSAGEMKGHVGPVTAMTISPDGRFSATGGHDGSIVLWDLRQRSSIRELSSDRVPIIRLDWDVDGRHVFVAREDGVLLLVDVSNGRIARRIAVEGDKLCAANLSADGGSCLVGLRDGSVQLYDLRSRELIRRFSGPSSKLVAVALSYDDRRAAAIGGDGTVRIWQLDWMPRFREFADWDERARPILEACATVHDAKAEKARGADIGERPLAETVKTKLTNRGLGWIRLEGILEVLGKRARQPEQVEDTQLLTMRTQQKSMIANPLKRQRAIRGARIAAVVLLLLMPLVWLTSHRRTLKQVRFDGDKVRETRMMRHQAIAGSPAGLFSQEVECQQELIDHYIGLYIRRHGRPEQIAKARICLEILADAKVVEPALGLLRVSEEETADSAGSDSSQDLDYVDDIISLLVNIGDAGTYELERGLRDRDPMLSLVSARVLALRSSPLAVETLLLHTEDPIDGVRIAVTTRLREIISSGHLTRYESMELLENLAKDENSMVRRNVVRSLRVLAGRRPRELATVLSLDSDPRVSQSARYLLDAGNPQL